MKLSLYTDDLRDAMADVVAVGVFSDEPDRGLAFSALNRGLDGALERACRDESFKGKAGQTLTFNVAGGIAATRVVVFGYGTRKQFGPERVRAFAGAAARIASKVGAKSLALQLTVPDDGAYDVLALVGALAEGSVLGPYVYRAHKTVDAGTDTLADVRIAFVAEDVQGVKGTALRAALKRGQTLAEAANFSRDLVNAPPNVLTPVELADRLKRMAKTAGLSCKILSMRDLDRQGMQLHLGVARGSTNEPRLIHLTYTPEAKTDRSVALVGKGLTFDAGGLSLKTSDGMLEMKSDMGGAAAVAGAMMAIAELKPECVVHGIIGAAENMPDGNAIRPSDVLTSKRGLTVEVINTDAEGRLVLADAIAYAQDQKVEELIDVATLTGACMVALGKLTAGAFVNDERMAARLEQAWKNSGESFWRMPLDHQLDSQLDSDIADVKNLGERWGGAITAALFLQRFVERPCAWAHLDIAGPVLSAEAVDHRPKGATGFGARTLAEYVMIPKKKA